MKIILDKWKCPVCNSALKQVNRAIFYCAINHLDFAVELLQDNCKELVVIRNQGYQYNIIQRHSEKYKNMTDIYVHHLDSENRIYGKSSHWKFDEIIFNFQCTDKEKILNRIKTIMVFQ